MRNTALRCLAITLVLQLVVVADSAEADGNLEVKSFASPVAAGCYLARDGSCHIHVEPFTANVADGEHLVRFQLKANGSVIYDFSTDVSNPPPGDFAPTLVGLDFAAVCDTIYTVSALTQDSGDPSLGVAGLTEPFTCPEAAPVPVGLIEVQVE